MSAPAPFLPPPSIAALLPAEIIALILEHFDYDYSLDAASADKRKRKRGLARAGSVARIWRVPARRLLFRSRELCHDACDFDCGDEELEERMTGLGADTQTLVLRYDDNEPDMPDDFLEHSIRAAEWTVDMLARAPNLRSLRIIGPPFSQFNAVDSAELREYPILRRLTDLRLYISQLESNSIVVDLVAASDRHVQRLSYVEHYDRDESIEVRPDTLEQVLDFGGNLRQLFTNCELFRMVGAGGGVGELEGLAGLEEFAFDGELMGCEDEMEEFARAVGPTLVTLEIRGGAPYPKQLVQATRLARIRLDEYSTRATFGLQNDISLATHFPNSLAYLHVHTDKSLFLTLADWATNPSLLPPSSLTQIRINKLSSEYFLDRLPPLDIFTAPIGRPLDRALQRLNPTLFRKARFARLEVFYYQTVNEYFYSRRKVAHAESERLQRFDLNDRDDLRKDFPRSSVEEEAIGQYSGDSCIDKECADLGVNCARVRESVDIFEDDWAWAS